MAKVLRPWAQYDRDQFDDQYTDRGIGCTCFISPPCGYCTHPGHPLSQEDDEFWYDDERVLVTLGNLADGINAEPVPNLPISKAEHAMQTY